MGRGAWLALGVRTVQAGGCAPPGGEGREMAGQDMPVPSVTWLPSAWLRARRHTSITLYSLVVKRFLILFYLGRITFICL